MHYELEFVVKRSDHPEAELKISIQEFDEEHTRAENPALNALLDNYEDIYGVKPTARDASPASESGHQTSEGPAANK
ncbi:MAG: hypothetical protein ABIG68_02840 [Acidobacteriota bacterium]